MKKIVIHEKFELRKSAWEMAEKISNWKKFLLEKRWKNKIVVLKIGMKFKSRKMRKRSYKLEDDIKKIFKTTTT